MRLNLDEIEARLINNDMRSLLEAVREARELLRESWLAGQSDNRPDYPWSEHVEAWLAKVEEK